MNYGHLIVTLCRTPYQISGTKERPQNNEGATSFNETTRAALHTAKRYYTLCLGPSHMHICLRALKTLFVSVDYRSWKHRVSVFAKYKHGARMLLSVYSQRSKFPSRPSEGLRKQSINLSEEKCIAGYCSIRPGPRNCSSRSASNWPMSLKPSVVIYESSN